MKIDYYAYSNVGERKVNEDTVGVFEQSNIYAFALCDGLGGHGKGDIASQTVVKAMLEETAALDCNDELINKAFEKANASLLEKQKQTGYSEMKTTGTFLAINDNKACWGHIGDSRIYYFHKNKFVKRTLDHSVPQMLVASGKIKEKDIRHHEDRNRLLRCIPWNSKGYEIDEKNFELKPGDSFIMMSDGLWDWVDEKQIRKCLKKGKSAQETVSCLVETAFKLGSGNNMDNLSVIVIRID